jgi:hypothetical protein
MQQQQEGVVDEGLVLQPVSVCIVHITDGLDHTPVQQRAAACERSEDARCLEQSALLAAHRVGSSVQLFTDVWPEQALLTGKLLIVVTRDWQTLRARAPWVATMLPDMQPPAILVNVQWLVTSVTHDSCDYDAAEFHSDYILAEHDGYCGCTTTVLRDRGGDALHRRALSLWAAGSCEVRISYDSRQHGGVGRDERIATLRYPVTAGACEINDMDVRSPHAVGWVVVDRHDGQTKFLYAHLLREVDAV